MSHEIEIQDGKVSMAYVGQVPWHGLGTELQPGATPAEIMKAANLDWKVTPRNLYFDSYENGKTKRCKVDNKVLVRDSDSKVLTVISKGWKPVQNSEAFDFFVGLCESGKMEMHTAGSLLGGKRVWALAKINECFELVVNGKKTRDVTEGYLLLTNPHEYGKSIDARLTGIRVVCNNTISMALGQKGAYSVALNHRKAFDPEKLKEMLGIAHISMEGHKEAAEFLATKRYTEEKAKEFFAAVWPLGNDEKRDAGELSRVARNALEIVETQPGADFAPGTYWNLFNAVTYTTDHLMGRSADTRMTSAWYGANRARKDEARSLAIEMAKAA